MEAAWGRAASCDWSEWAAGKHSASRPRWFLLAWCSVPAKGCFEQNSGDLGLEGGGVPTWPTGAPLPVDSGARKGATVMGG